MPTTMSIADCRPVPPPSSSRCGHPSRSAALASWLWNCAVSSQSKHGDRCERRLLGRRTGAPITLITGDRLLFYTDGITETRNAQGRQLGPSRLSEIARAALSAETFDMADHIIQDVERFRDKPPTDDMTLIVVEMR